MPKPLSSPASPAIQREGRLLTTLSMITHRGELAFTPEQQAEIALSAAASLPHDLLLRLHKRVESLVASSIIERERQDRRLEAQ